MSRSWKKTRTNGEGTVAADISQMIPQAQEVEWQREELVEEFLGGEITAPGEAGSTNDETNKRGDRQLGSHRD